MEMEREISKWKRPDQKANANNKEMQTKRNCYTHLYLLPKEMQILTAKLCCVPTGYSQAFRGRWKELTFPKQEHIGALGWRSLTWREGGGKLWKGRTAVGEGIVVKDREGNLYIVQEKKFNQRF